MDWVQTTSVELPVVESFQRQVARELHDGVAQTLTTMLIEIENFKSDQQGRPGVIQRLSGCQDTVREVLNELRGLLFELRGESAVDSTLISSLKSTYGVQFGRRQLAQEHLRGRVRQALRHDCPLPRWSQVAAHHPGSDSPPPASDRRRSARVRITHPRGAR